MRVIRGGGWAHAPWHCRSAYRGKYSTDQRNDTLGFRVATTMPNSPAATVQTPPAGPLFPVDGRVSIGACRYKLTELRVNERTTSLQRNPSMAVLKDGRVLVAWESYDQPVGSDCWGRAFSPEGAVLGSEFHLNPHNSSGWEYGPSLGALPDGGFVVAWGAESREVRLQRFDKSLRAAGRDSQVIGVDIWPAVSVLSRGDFVVGLGNATWGAGGRRYRASGAPVGDVFRASTRPLAFGKEHQQIVATAPAADGGFVVTWFTGLENSDVLVRRYDANGAPLGGEFTVNTTKGCGNVFPTVAVNSTNDLIVAWNRRGPGKDSAIVARRFAPDNGPLTDEWVVNQHASGRQDCPNVVVGPGGEYLVSWPHDEGAGQDIYARLYDATDKPLGPSFRVNLFTAGTQSLPRCASRRATAVVGKNLFFAWHGAGPGDEGGVFLTVLNRVD